jgi:ATP synthase protein I
MADFEPGNKERKDNRDWEDHVNKKERRKIRARNEKEQNIWFGLGMFGVIGWSIAVPTLLGIFIGLWIDRNWPSQFSWTLMLMFAGLIVGCMNAWNWIHKESGVNRRRNKEEQKEDE